MRFNIVEIKRLLAELDIRLAAECCPWKKGGGPNQDRKQLAMVAYQEAKNQINPLLFEIEQAEIRVLAEKAEP